MKKKNKINNSRWFHVPFPVEVVKYAVRTFNRGIFRIPSVITAIYRYNIELYSDSAPGNHPHPFP